MSSLRAIAIGKATGGGGGGGGEITVEALTATENKTYTAPSGKAYSPVVDLRERDARPDMDAQALSMLHLDMVAAEKGLKPLNPSFWNQF